MRRTVITFLLITLTWLSYSVTMNDFGQFEQNDKNSEVSCVYENEQFNYSGDVITVTEGKLYFNGMIIADLPDFLSILADTRRVFVVTNRTIFSLTGEVLRPLLTFNELINDLAYLNGEFHVSLKKTIMNGYKFTHIKITSNNDISTVDTAILDLKKKNLPDDEQINPLVLKSPGRILVKGSY
ncbi:MAG: hypothetical protein PHF33_01360 [Candidatus Delongbacteria bacterium]|nr:hypothetical protein [Candidatus Delongbacteria bacterium]MDD4204950.1 hypothetical protein [Candidatus Delongbacteria bacterium]MDY0018203.1 hypothetical protein [Candidatus Delongbacteria bacterium]